MIKLYFLLSYEFFKIGLFAVGGGYATLPFLFHLQTQYRWFTIDELTNMIAISNITPGPVGINMATYTGYTTAGLIGSFLATSSIILAPAILVIIVSKLIEKYKSSCLVVDIFNTLRPASCALLSVIAIQLLYKSVVLDKIDMILNLDYKALTLFLFIFIPFLFFKKNPLLTILVGAIGGILIKSF